MKALRNMNLAVIKTPAPDDDAHLETDELTSKQEAFVRAWVETGNKAAAYRLAYDVNERTLPNVIWVASSRLSARPHILRRYKELIERAALETIMTARELFRIQVDIITADVGEIVKVMKRSCRFCHGINGKYQWRDEDEYTAACVKALDKGKMPPSDVGGYEFSGALLPNPTCAECYGAGVSQTVISDTDSLTGAARHLYAGAKQDRFGCVEVILRSKDKATMVAAQMLGILKSPLDARTPEERAKADEQGKLSPDVTEKDAVKAYLQLIQ